MREDCVLAGVWFIYENANYTYKPGSILSDSRVNSKQHPIITTIRSLSEQPAEVGGR